MLETHTSNALLLKQVWNFLEQVGILQKKSKVHCNPKIKDWTGKFVFLWVVPLELKVPKTTQSILNAGCSTVTDWWAKWFWPKIKVVNFLCVLNELSKSLDGKPFCTLMSVSWIVILVFWTCIKIFPKEWNLKLVCSRTLLLLPTCVKALCPNWLKFFYYSL